MPNRWSALLLVAIVAAATTANATTVGSAAAACAAEPISAKGPIQYVCDCQAGADAKCVAGNDQDSGTTPAHPWRSYKKAIAAYNTIPEGGTVALCRGGAFSADGIDTRVANGNCRAKHPCVLRDYHPTIWKPKTDRQPIIHSGAKNTALQLAESDPHHKEGFRILNLDLEGDGATESTGVFLYNDFTDVFICGLTINEMKGAAVLFGGAASYPPGCYQAGPPIKNTCPFQRRVTIQGNRFSNIAGTGFFGYGVDVNLNYNRWENIGATNAFDHVVYFGAAEIDHLQPMSQVILENEHLIGNEFIDAGWGGKCDGTMVVAHGAHAGLVVQGNEFRFEKHTKASNCFAIDLTGGTVNYLDLFRDALVDGNRIEGFSTQAIVISSCQGCTVSNNLIVSDDPSQGSVCIGAGVELGERYDLGTTNAKIENNTCYLSGQRSSDRGIRIAGQGSGYVLANNATVFDAPTPGNTFYCYDYALGVEAVVGTAVSKDLSALRQIRNGGFDLTVDGKSGQVTGLDFSSAATMGDLAVAMTSAMGASGLDAKATWMGNGFTLNTAATPGPGTISLASKPTGPDNPTDISGTIGLSAASGAKVTPTYAFANNALCYAPPGPSLAWDFATKQSLRTWRASSGRDMASVVSNPMFVNARASGYDFHPLAGSPLVGAANRAFAPALDLEGVARGGLPDIGAYQHLPVGSSKGRAAPPSAR
jgi:hypothetical protein